MISDPYRMVTVNPSRRVYRNGTASLHRAQSGVTAELMATLGFIDEHQHERIYRAHTAAAATQKVAHRMAMRRYQVAQRRQHWKNMTATMHRGVTTVAFPLSLCAVVVASLLFVAPHAHASEDMLERSILAHPLPFVVMPKPIDATISRLGSQPIALENKPIAKLIHRFTATHPHTVSLALEALRAHVLAAIPSLDPTKGGEVTSPFGYRSYPDAEFHRGVDLAEPIGHPVDVSADGIVTFAGWAGGFGNKIEVDHGNGYYTWYGHLSHIDVTVGEHVTRGFVIGEVGETGYATGPHLHYQIMLNGVAVDPTPYLRGIPSSVLASVKTR